jgi:hypothetical protein
MLIETYQTATESHDKKQECKLKLLGRSYQLGRYIPHTLDNVPISIFGCDREREDDARWCVV